MKQIEIFTREYTKSSLSWEKMEVFQTRINKFLKEHNIISIIPMLLEKYGQPIVFVIYESAN